MLLAAGFGRRMVPITCFRVKPALPFLNRPLLLRQLDYLEQAGVQEVVVNLHHRKESALNLLRQAQSPPGAAAGGPFRIGALIVHISLEDEIQGTSGGLKQAAEHFSSGETFVCLNSDFVCDIDLAAAVAAHRASGREATLVLIDEHPGFAPVLHDGHQVLSFGSEGHAGARRGTFTGIHVLEPSILERLPEGRSEFLPHLYQPMIASGSGPGIWVARGRWVEVGTPARYIEAQIDALAGEPFDGCRAWPQAGGRGAGVVIDESAQVDSLTLTGDGCHIGPGVRLGPGALLAGGITVEKDAELERCVILDGARIGAGASLRDTIVGPATAVPEGASVSRALLDGDSGQGSPASRWQGMWRADF